MAESFSGNGYITIPGNGTPIDVIGAEMTMSVWFKMPLYPTTEVDFIAKWGAGGNEYLLNMSEFSHGQTSVAWGHPGIVNFAHPTVLTVTNVWHNLVAYWDNAASNSAIYLDGVFGTTVAASGSLTPSGHSLFLGARDTGLAQAYNGVLAEVGIWNAALKQVEITALAKGIPPNRVRRTKLVGYWPLYGVASPEPDLSGNVQNGVKTNATPVTHCPVSNPY